MQNILMIDQKAKLVGVRAPLHRGEVDAISQTLANLFYTFDNSLTWIPKLVIASQCLPTKFMQSLLFKILKTICRHSNWLTLKWKVLKREHLFCAKTHLLLIKSSIHSLLTCLLLDLRYIYYQWELVAKVSGGAASENF